jgi:hypothetical protein
VIEVFVAYQKASDIDELEETLDAWDLPGMEPVAVEVTIRKFELARRVTAENVSRGNYILADLGTGPLEENFGELAEKELAERKDTGLIGVWRTGQTASEVPNSVVICRKGIVGKWPTPQSETYIQEHIWAYRFAGYRTFLCSTLHYHRLTASLPC